MNKKCHDLVCFRSYATIKIRKGNYCRKSIVCY